jgi:hypothetical protein
MLISTRRLRCAVVCCGVFCKQHTQLPTPLSGHPLRLGSAVLEVSKVFCFQFGTEEWNLKRSESPRRFGHRNWVFVLWSQNTSSRLNPLTAGSWLGLILYNRVAHHIHWQPQKVSPCHFRQSKLPIGFVRSCAAWLVTFSGRSTHICALKGKVQLAEVHIFVHWKVRFNWPKYTYLCSER